MDLILKGKNPILKINIPNEKWIIIILDIKHQTNSIGNTSLQY